MEVTNENYFDADVQKEYMSFHTWASLHGTIGLPRCEAMSMAIMNGTYEDDRDEKAFLIGSYVDAKLAGSDEELEKFKEEHPEIFVSRGTNKGELKADFKMAEAMIKRAESDPLFMQFMSGEHQRIFTAELFGAKWKCKLDSYVPGKCIVDLKTTRDIHKQFYVPDVGYVDFSTFYNYIGQLALYQRIVEENTGEHLPCFIAAISKSNHPEIKIIHIDDVSLHDALVEIKNSCENTGLLDVWKGKTEPIRCGLPTCHYCVDTEVLKGVVNYKDLIME